MKDVFTGVFKNNGKARGWLYIILPTAALLGERFTQWSENPPRNGWEVAAVAVACVVASGTALRAYMDQHLSKQEGK